MNFVKQYVVKLMNYNRIGKAIYFDEYFKRTAQLSSLENLKKPRRTDIINYLISLVDGKNYLEIGVRDPRKNFNKIQCATKFSVDPGIEFEDNPVDFDMTSDLFF
ncbi:hypothetical protein [Bizionia psychrotolerans]|uniref:hypothetical protein n=1 Tax=Bizionia psychrotolerans TaxID=1492901 RepID=UPI00069F346F|nr:hypothetical protein [Bizionia psychrotolerans]